MKIQAKTRKDYEYLP